MKKEDEFENITRRKDFASLTEEEKAIALKSIGSEEEYEAIRRIELTMLDEKFRSSLEPNAKILSSLRQRMKMHSTSFDWKSIFQFKIPAYAAFGAVVAIAVLVYFLLPSEPAKFMASGDAIVPVVRIDTVFVTKTDTIVRERIVYRQVKTTPMPVTVDPAILVHQKQPVTNGVNMKEKEELNRLLVSGSD